MQGKLQDGSIIISGVLGKDAEYKTVGDKGSSLTKFGVKIGETPSTEVDGKPTAKWVNCVCWHAVARATQNLKKLDVVLCVGKVKTEQGAGEHAGKTFTSLECEAVFIMGSSPADIVPTPPQNSDAPIPTEFEEVLGDPSQLPF